MNNIVELFGRFTYLSSGTISFPSLGHFPTLASMAIERAQDTQTPVCPTGMTANLNGPMDAISIAQLFNYNSLSPDLGSLVSVEVNNHPSLRWIERIAFGFAFNN